jgi:endonuclease/exonuclease/phosphatase family metal-dependent hydrolase
MVVEGPRVGVFVHKTVLLAALVVVLLFVLMGTLAFRCATPSGGARASWVLPLDDAPVTAADLAVERSRYSIGQRVIVDVTTPVPAQVGLFAAGASTPLRVLDTPAGHQRALFAPPLMLPAGAYEARLLQGQASVASTPFTVVDEADLPPPPFEAVPGELTLVSFNAWESGRRVDDGPAKIADAIAAVGGDVVGLPECDEGCASRIAARLRTLPGYGDARFMTHNGLHRIRSFSIVSRLPFVEQWEGFGLRGMGVKVLVDGVPVRVFAVHLSSFFYSPYEARNAPAPEEVRFASHESGRASEWASIDERLVSKNDPALPTVVLGDFNAPSHLDWTPANAAQNAGHSFAFPLSRALEAKGFVDAYRAVHPDPIESPGFTWTPGAPKGALDDREVHDRIDYVYARGAREVRQAFVYARDPWPSDHAALVVRLAFDVTAKPTKP